MPRENNELRRAGHQEIQGETIAKFEFFDNGFNPYSRYLDIDKVDLVLRKRLGKEVRYIDVQVKYGRLYKCGPKWQKTFFDYTSWRPFTLNQFSDAHDNLYIAYVLSYPSGYKGDILIFPARVFNELIAQSIPKKSSKPDKVRRDMYLAHCHKNDRWYLWKKSWSKDRLELPNEEFILDITNFRRDFKI